MTNSIQIGTLKIIDRNGNDRFDPTIDGVQVPHKYESICPQHDSFGLAEQLQISGIGEADFRKGRLSRMGEVIRLVEFFERNPKDFRPNILRGAARSAGLDEAPLLNRLAKNFRALHDRYIHQAKENAAISPTTYDQLSSTVSHISRILDQARLCGNLLRNVLGEDFEFDEVGAKKIWQTPFRKAIEWSLRQAIDCVRSGMDTESLLLALEKIEDYSQHFIAPDQVKFYELLKTYAILAEDSFPRTEAKPLLREIIEIQEKLRLPLYLEIAHPLISRSEELALELKENYGIEVGVHPTLEEAGRRFFEANFAEVEDALQRGYFLVDSWQHMASPSDLMQARGKLQILDLQLNGNFFYRCEEKLKTLRDLALQYELDFDTERADRLLELARKRSINFLFEFAEFYAREGDLEATHEWLNSAWAVSSELNAEYDTEREASILDRLQNPPPDRHLTHGLRFMTPAGQAKPFSLWPLGVGGIGGNGVLFNYGGGSGYMNLAPLQTFPDVKWPMNGHWHQFPSGFPSPYPKIDLGYSGIMNNFQTTPRR